MIEGHTLAIEKLPAAASSLFPGRVYLVRHDGLAPLSDMLWPTLLKTSAQWVCGSDIETVIAGDAPLAVRIRKALENGAIRAYRCSEGKWLQPVRMMEELVYYGVKRGTLIAIDCAASFFGGAFASTVEAFRGFARENACAVILLAKLEDAEQTSDALAGSAVLRQAETGPVWEVSYWFGAAGVIAGAAFRLSLLKGGGFTVEAGGVEPRQEALSLDANAIFVTRAALAGKKLPEGWQVVENFDEAGSALSGAAAATIILHFDQDTVLGELTRLVFNLRQACGKQAKILIRQINAHLRHSQEQLLLRLGANFVIPAEVLFSHLNGFVEMVQGQVYAHDLESDYEGMIGRVMPGTVQGYLMPQAFVDAARDAMERSRALMIRNILVKLRLAPGLTPMDALRSCWMKRKGDCCTADEDNVYLFLFACRESNVDLTLDRQFSYPVSVLFEGQELYLVDEDIFKALDILKERTKGGTYPDIALVNPADGEAGGERGWLPVTAEHHVIPHVPPSIAVRRPLVLRKALP